MSIAARTTNGAQQGMSLSSSANVAVTFGSAVASTDIVVAVFGINSPGAAESFSAPSGWTAIMSTITGNSSNPCVTVSGWWALGNVASKTFTHSGAASDTVWATQAFTGVDTTTPIDSTGPTTAHNSGSASVSISSWNVTNANALPVILGVDWNGGSYSIGSGIACTFLTSSSGYASSGFIGNSADLTGWLCYTNSAIGSAGGATGAISISDSGGASGNFLAAMPFALNPLAASFIASPPLSVIQAIKRSAYFRTEEYDSTFIPVSKRRLFRPKGLLTLSK